MLFKDIEAIPGVVIDAEDPENLLRVKAAVPGIFDPGTMSKKALPWVYRFPMGGYQQYSKMMTGSRIWVLRNTKNYYEFWYIPFSNLNSNTLKAAKSEADVLISRYTGEADAQLYYNKEEGFKTILGANYIQLDSDGNTINMSNGYSSKIYGEHYYVGEDGGEYEPMVLGKKLTELFKQLSSDLDELASVAESSPYTSQLSMPIRKIKLNIDKSYPEITSKDCSLT